MGKVVTSEGLTEFVQSGKVTHVPNHKPGKSNGEAPALEVVKTAPVIDVKPAGETKEEPKSAEKSQEPPPKAPETEAEGLDPDQKDLPERVRKQIGKKHAQMKAAEALAAQRAQEAEEAERFAEAQYNERTLLQRRADAAEAKLRELEAKAAPVKPIEPAKEPDIKDYTTAEGVDWVKFQKDTAKYAADEAVRELKKSQADERAQAEKAEQLARLRSQAAKAREAHPDFDQVMSALQGTPADQAPQFVLHYIEESAHSAEVAYYLAKNPDETQRIAKLKPILGIAELGKLEDKLTKSQSSPESAATPVRSERSGAPAPITPLEGDGSVGIQTDPAKMSYKELRAYHRAQRAEKQH